MAISRESIEELRKILKEDYKREYSDQEMFEIATGIVGFFDNLMKFDYADKLAENKEKLTENS